MSGDRDGLQYALKGQKKNRSEEEDFFGCSVPFFIKTQTQMIETELKKGMIPAAIAAEFDDRVDHPIMLEADAPSRLLVAGFRKKILTLAHQQALSIYKAHPDSALAILGYGIAHYLRQTPRTDSSMLEADPPFFQYLQSDQDPVTVPMLNDYAYILSKTATHPETRDTILSKAAVLLERVIALEPKRDAAYLNLGDALWDLARQADAKVKYGKYVELARKKGKKIPNEVFDRIK
jgi:hypothetical protein